jgi:hypothetical protein
MYQCLVLIFEFDYTFEDVLSKEISNSPGTRAGHPQEGPGKVSQQGASRVSFALCSRNLQSSIEKKKHVMRTATNKEHRIGSITKNDSHERSEKVMEKHISLFSN